jgi:mannose-6-phosphate isomerase-like protein (cupin superfamily)
MKQHQKRKPRRSVEPRVLKKANRPDSSVFFAGERTPTETGFRITAYSTPALETFFECFLLGACSPTYRHETLDRVIWVLNGSGYVELNGEVHKVDSGDSVVVTAGTTHRILTAANSILDILACAPGEYQRDLLVVVPSEAPRAPSAADLAETRHSETDHVMQPRRGSKAAFQQSLSGRKAHRDSSPQVATAPQMNPKPSNGRFDEEGAG